MILMDALPLLILESEISIARQLIVKENVQDLQIPVAEVKAQVNHGLARNEIGSMNEREAGKVVVHLLHLDHQVHLKLEKLVLERIIVIEKELDQDLEQVMMGKSESNSLKSSNLLFQKRTMLKQSCLKEALKTLSLIQLVAVKELEILV